MVYNHSSWHQKDNGAVRKLFLIAPFYSLLSPQSENAQSIKLKGWLVLD
jgi:hypothetical protein